jgi:hypothetical protein
MILVLALIVGYVTIFLALGRLQHSVFAGFLLILVWLSTDCLFGFTVVGRILKEMGVRFYGSPGYRHAAIVGIAVCIVALLSSLFEFGKVVL